MGIWCPECSAYRITPRAGCDYCRRTFGTPTYRLIDAFSKKENILAPIYIYGVVNLQEFMDEAYAEAKFRKLTYAQVASLFEVNKSIKDADRAVNELSVYLERQVIFIAIPSSDSSQITIDQLNNIATIRGVKGNRTIVIVTGEFALSERLAKYGKKT